MSATDTGYLEPYFGDEPVTTEAEFLGLDDVIAKATERTKASETAADELVRLHEALRTWLPSIVTGDTARAAGAWKGIR